MSKAPFYPYNLLSAVDRMRRYVKMCDKQPVAQKEDIIYSVHAGKWQDAEFLLSDLRLVLEVLP